ncbi:MAG: KEOPS complex kinase/ATPase Bud32 [Candidatus Bathyarchaeota archaeon]|nr:KEOPS complex kinase/ATPase Bud32 [Candidatus Bathyarchaeota archaeon]
MVLLAKGAEASLYLETWHGRKVIMKKRHPKKYRIPELEDMIRSQRTVHEPNIMHKAKEAGVPTPTIFMVDVAEGTVIMEFVEGKQVKEVLLNEDSSEMRRTLCFVIGLMIGKMHQNGIIHGDLTTSNMILTPYGKVVFVDFGLSERSIDLEAKGVDIHLLKRALYSTHYMHAKQCFDAVMQGYGETVGRDEANQVFQKIKEIEKRGRYVAER